MGLTVQGMPEKLALTDATVHKMRALRCGLGGGMIAFRLPKAIGIEKSDGVALTRRMGQGRIG
jgi:hypothetical protein